MDLAAEALQWGRYAKEARYLRPTTDPKEETMSRRPSMGDLFTNMNQPMPLPEKLTKLTRNLWRRVVLRQNCCGNHGEPGC